MGELIANMRAAYQREDQPAPRGWTSATRAEALAKLATFDPRTGHPAKYIDYSTLQVGRGDLLGNAIARRANSTGSCSCRAFPSRSTAACGK